MHRNDFSHIPPFFRQKVENLFEINRGYSARYLSQLTALEQYKKEHPTQMIIFKCSDGRLLFSRMTQMPLGFLKSFRNMGGKFNHGWEGLKNALKGMVLDSHLEYLKSAALQSKEESLRIASKQQEFLDLLELPADFLDSEMRSAKRGDFEIGNCSLAIVTYHYSEGDNESRGCKASDFNKELSIANAKGFRMSLEKAYKNSSHKLIAIVMGIETDEDVLILHGENGQVCNLGTFSDVVPLRELFMLICLLYPSMPLQMKLDLLPVLHGNIRHIAEVRKTKRPIEEMTHGEWILGVCNSESADSITVPNTAVLVGLANPDMPKVIRIGLDVIKPNAEKGFLLLTAAPYGGDESKSTARQVAKYYSRLAQEQIDKHYPELKKFAYPLPLLVNRQTQLFELVTKNAE